MFVIHKQSVDKNSWWNSDIPSDRYDVETLIGMCDDLDNTVWERMSKNAKNPYSCDLKYFIRTIHGNKVLMKGDEVVFIPTLKCKGETLSDFVLLSAKNVLDVVFKGTQPIQICEACVPTPFGITTTDTGFEILMQICYNSDSELKVPTGYDLVPFDKCKAEVFDKIRKTLKKTKE